MGLRGPVESKRIIGSLSLAFALVLSFGSTELVVHANTAAPNTAAAETAVTNTEYRSAQYVQINLAGSDLDSGIRLVTEQPDGLTQVQSDGSGRQSLPNRESLERFFYFDLHDSYIYGGRNKVTMTVTYKDIGQNPVYLDYDSYDPIRPAALTDDLVKRRIHLLTRTNTESWKTAFVTLEDARFAGLQPGGADFRIGSTDQLILRSVSARLLAHEEPPGPPRIILNDRLVLFDPDDAQPFIHPITGRTLVPMRAMFKAFGIADEDIRWEQESRSVEVKRRETRISLAIDQAIAYVNGIPIQMDQPAIIMADRTFVPLRFVMDQFGLEIEWDGEERVITLTSRYRIDSLFN